MPTSREEEKKKANNPPIKGDPAKNDRDRKENKGHSR